MEIHCMGGLNGAFILIENITKNMRTKLCTKLGIVTNNFVFRTLSRISTFIVIDLCWIFFNAHSLGVGISIIQKIVCDFRVKYFFTEEFWGSFGTIENFAIMMITLLIVFIVDIAKEHGIDIKTKIFEQQIIVRWALYMMMILVILFWGVYGEGYVQTQFIYFQF